jgi:hypothetical protein
VRATIHERTGAVLEADARRTPHAASGVAPARGAHTRVAVIALAVATVAIGVAYASALLGGSGGPPRWAPWLLALGVPTALVSVMTLGAARHGRVPGVLLAAFVLVGVTLAAGFALALALPAAAGTAGEPLLLGLPRRAAIVVYGIGLLPVLVLPVAYALTFEAQTLRDEDLARVMAAGDERRAREEVSR